MDDDAFSRRCDGVLGAHRQRVVVVRRHHSDRDSIHREGVTDRAGKAFVAASK